MFCGRCGNKLNDGDRFCGVCGSVVHPIAPAPVVEEPVVEQSVVPVPVVNIVEQNTMPVPPMQPVYQEPVPNTNYGDAYNQVPAQKQKKVRTLKQTSAGVKVLSIFLCIFMFCFALSSTMVCIVRNFLAEENITQVMEEFDVSDIKLVDKYGKQVTLTDVIYNTIKDETKEKYGISKKDVG